MSDVTAAATMSADRSCRASFTRTSHTLTLTAAGKGPGDVSGAGTHGVGDTISISATTDTGSTFAGWGGSDCASSARARAIFRRAFSAVVTIPTVGMP